MLMMLMVLLVLMLMIGAYVDDGDDDDDDNDDDEEDGGDDDDDADDDDADANDKDDYDDFFLLSTPSCLPLHTPHPLSLTNHFFPYSHETAENVGERVTEKMESLAKQLKRDLREGMFTKEVSDTIEVIRELSDLKELAAKVKAHGAIAVGLMLGESFVENMRKLTNSVDHIPTEELKECYRQFLKSFEQYIANKEVAKIDSKQVIKDYLRSDEKLYVGNEVIIVFLQWQ